MTTPADLADHLLDLVRGVLADLESMHAPSLELPRVFGGHVVGPDARADLAFTLGLLHAEGIDRVAGIDCAEVALEVVRRLNGPQTHSFYSYRAAETIARLGGLDDNSRLAGWTDSDRENAGETIDSSSMLKMLDEGQLPNNYAVVLTRCEIARRAIGQLPEDNRLDELLEKLRTLFAALPTGWWDDFGGANFDMYTPDVYLFAEPFADELGGAWETGLRRVLADLEAVATPGGAISWGRSTGALGIVMNVELGAVALSRSITDDRSGWLGKAELATRALEGWFERGVVNAHQHKMTMGYRRPRTSSPDDPRSARKVGAGCPRAPGSRSRRRRDPGGLVPSHRSPRRLRSEAQLRRVGLSGQRRLRPSLRRWILGRLHAFAAMAGHLRGPGRLPASDLVVTGDPQRGCGPHGLGPAGGTASRAWSGRGPPRELPESQPRWGRRRDDADRWQSACDLPRRGPIARRRRVAAHRHRPGISRCGGPSGPRGGGSPDCSRVLDCASAHLVDRRHVGDAEAPFVLERTCPCARVGARAGNEDRLHLARHARVAGGEQCRWALVRPEPLRAARGPSGDAEGVSLLDDPVALSEFDVFHLHWPEWAAGVDAERTRQVIANLRAAGITILWTQHNRVPHHFPDAVEIYRIWTAEADAVIHHSEYGRAVMEAEYEYGEHTRHAVIPHGHWGHRLEPLRPAGGKSEAEKALGLEPATIRLGIVGAPRAQKDVQLVLDAFHRSSRDDIQLCVWSLGDEDVPDDSRIIAEPYDLSDHTVYARRQRQQRNAAPPPTGRSTPSRPWDSSMT